MSLAPFLLVALSAHTSPQAPDVRVLVLRGDDPPIELCAGVEAADHRVRLRWSNGDDVVWRKLGASFVADVPAATRSSLPAGDTMTVQWGQTTAVVSTDPLVASRTVDAARWVFADDATNPTSVPAAPLSIWVPDAAPEPVAGPAHDGATAAPEVHDDAPDSKPPGMELLAFLGRAAGVCSAKEPIAEAVRDALERPATVNPVLAGLFTDGHGLRFLRDVDWHLQSFDVDGETSLGVRFKYEKHHPFELEDHANGKGVSGMGFDLSIEGNVAFERDVNPADFLSARLAFDKFSSSGGSKGPLAPADAARANALAMQSAKYVATEREAWLRSPEWNELKGLARRVLDTQVYWEVGIDAAFESDQAWDAKNYALGVHGALDVKAWNDRSEAATLNLVDYPAALVRYLTGYDDELTPRGSSIPTLVIGLDHVEPEGESPRSAAGDDSGYERVRLEVVYKAPLGLIESKEYSLTAQYRGYYELSPSDAVRAADLDRYGYLALAIEADEGLFASYSHGQLPFDDGDSTVYAIGWRFQF